MGQRCYIGSLLCRNAQDVKNKKGFGVKEQKPAIIHIKAEWPFEKDNQKPTGLFSDWEGNYKKGTFTLVCPSPSKADKSFSSYTERYTQKCPYWN